ncbi:MAG: sigma-70 family RNA polymerase sigma factor [Phycisphaerae bacterium]
MTPAPLKSNFGPQERPGELIEGCQGLVRNIAWQIHQKLGKRVELDDLIAYGQIGLAEAAKRFDAVRGNKFTTYAYYRIRGAIFDGLGKMAWFSKAAYHAERYFRLSNELLDEENAEHDTRGTGGIVEETAWLSDVGTRLAMVYLVSSTAGNAQIESQADPDSENAGAMVDSLIGTEVRRELVRHMDELPQQERSLIHMLYFDGLSLRDAGAKLGISKSWASRKHSSALRRLANALRDWRGAVAT